METEQSSEESERKKSKALRSDQRAAYTLGEFASLFGKHKNWAYRLAWTGKVKVIKPLGEMLVPRSEVDRLTSAPVDYETMNAQASR
jgi:hypothetical protein